LPFTAAIYTKVSLQTQLCVNNLRTEFHRSLSKGSMIILLSDFRRHSRWRKYVTIF